MILDVIGTSFYESNIEDLENYDLKELYKLAFKNKIGLFFLERLEENKKIGELSKQLEEQRKLKLKQENTWIRTVDALNKAKCEYAIIKSIFPFPAIPNDVDALILGDDAEYRRAIEFMKNDQFIVLDEAALEINLRDTTTAETLKISEKEWVDVDLYKEVGAGRLVYMDKNKLKKYLEIMDLKGRKISVLKPYAEMAINIFHAMYPERIYTLMIHYYILHTIYRMNDEETDDFVTLCKEQRIGNGIRNTLSVTEIIEEKCHGTVPKKITELRAKFGSRKEYQISKIPFVYPLSVLINSLWGKIGERKFFISALKQIGVMFNPKTANFVIKVYKERASRDTY